MPDDQQHEQQRRQRLKRAMAHLPPFWSTFESFRRQCDRRRALEAWKNRYVQAHRSLAPLARVARQVVDSIEFIDMETFAKAMLQGLAELRQRMAQAGVRGYRLVVMGSKRRAVTFRKTPGFYKPPPSAVASAAARDRRQEYQKRWDQLMDTPFAMAADYKSGEWLGRLVIRELAKAGGPEVEDIVRIHDNSTWQPWEGVLATEMQQREPVHYVYVDDASYSGTQLRNVRRSFMDSTGVPRNAHLWVLIPFLSAKVADTYSLQVQGPRWKRPRLRNTNASKPGKTSAPSGKNCTVLPPVHVMPMAADVLQRIDGFEPSHDTDTRTLTLFEHKIPDEASFVPDLLHGNLIEELPPPDRPNHYRFRLRSQSVEMLTTACPAAGKTDDALTFEHDAMTTERPYYFNSVGVLRDRIRRVAATAAPLAAFMGDRRGDQRHEIDARNDLTSFF